MIASGSSVLTFAVGGDDEAAGEAVSSWLRLSRQSLYVVG